MMREKGSVVIAEAPSRPLKPPLEMEVILLRWKGKGWFGSVLDAIFNLKWGTIAGYVDLS
jgi:hypothetical protein